MTAPKILTLDLESSPNLADVWSLWNQNVGLSQLREASRVIAFAAKWYGVPKVEFYCDFDPATKAMTGHAAMVQRAYELLDEADIVVDYNGATFDLPHLRREFLLAGLPPPSPVEEIDLLKTVRKQFNFPSNKLQYVTTALGMPGKVQTTGHELWVRCLAGDSKAWALMKKYNIGDVVITEQLYDRLRAWIPNHPHMGLYGPLNAVACATCGSTRLQRRGLSRTALSVFQRYQCQDCGRWSRDKAAVHTVDARGVA